MPYMLLEAHNPTLIVILVRLYPDSNLRSHLEHISRTVFRMRDLAPSSVAGS